jgi:hypothetical protein
MSKRSSEAVFAAWDTAMKPKQHVVLKAVGDIPANPPTWASLGSKLRPIPMLQESLAYASGVSTPVTDGLLLWVSLLEAEVGADVVSDLYAAWMAELRLKSMAAKK